MSHPLWCGQCCSDCPNPCQLDSSIPCSPDCPLLNSESGEPDNEECKTCDALNPQI